LAFRVIILFSIFFEQDTNNAGRLILADTMIYAQEVYKPSMVVDVATLTKEVQSTLGGSAAGVFSNSEFLWLQLSKAGSLTGDRVWRFPLWDYFRDKVSGYDHVDLSNQGKGAGGQCCLGAAFLQVNVETPRKCVMDNFCAFSGIHQLRRLGPFGHIGRGHAEQRARLSVFGRGSNDWSTNAHPDPVFVPAVVPG
jgi:Cytosol aminopeptidase family, catalytic domain